MFITISGTPKGERFTEVATSHRYVAREMKRKGIDIMGITKMHWTGQGKVQLAGDSIIYTGRDDDNHRHQESRYIDVKKYSLRALRVEPY